LDELFISEELSLANKDQEALIVQEVFEKEKRMMINKEMIR
jgi:hypothetical protein